MTDWQAEETTHLLAKYGTVPPPWVVLPTAHPSSIGWRMGYGESFMELWWNWWNAQEWNEDKQIAYFRQFKPPYAWLQWVIFVLWPEAQDEYSEGLEQSEEEADRILLPYFERLEKLDFGSVEDWRKDFEREDWD